MDITYFIRSEQSAISIGKHFRPLIAEIGKTERVETYYMPSATYGIRGIVLNLRFTFRHRNRKGINHVTGDCHFIIFALLGCRTVLTVHDLGFYVSHKHEMNPVKRFLIYYLQVYWPIKLADKVIAISNKTKEEILEAVPYRRQIDMARHVSIDMFPYTPKEFGSGGVRVLQIGTSPHKNLETTAKAVARCGCELRVIKKMSDAQVQLADSLKMSYSNAYNLSDEEMAGEYQEADIVCFPSLYEGFGAPVIEAQATGRPVITSNLEPMKSVSGGGAYLMKDPKNVDEMCRAIMRIINDSGYREGLIEAGRRNARKYMLANCAKEHIGLYRELQ